MDDSGRGAVREESLRAVLLVRAFEEGDEAGELVGHPERQIATREVRNELASGGKEPDPETFLARRARRLGDRILRSHPRCSSVSSTRISQASTRIIRALSC